MAGLFCQLQRTRFDGMLHVTCGARSAAIGFRSGVPVTFLDPMQGHTLGEDLVESGRLTRAQYSTVIARVTDGLVEDEAVAFYEHAVQLGYLTEQDAHVELSSRIRTCLMQVLSWTDCEVVFDTGAVFLDGQREFPQNTGALVYMGVRTFYEEDYLERFFQQPWRTYLRLLAPAQTIAEYFGLDDDELQLLQRSAPAAPLSKLLNDPNVERAHVLGLLMLVRLAELCEMGGAPFANDREASGARAAPARPLTAPVTSDDTPTLPPPPDLQPSAAAVARPANRPLMPNTGSSGAYRAVAMTESTAVTPPRTTGGSSGAYRAVAATEHAGASSQRSTGGSSSAYRAVAAAEHAASTQQQNNGNSGAHRAVVPPESRPLTNSDALSGQAASTPRANTTSSADATQEALREAAARTAKARKATTTVRRGPPPSTGSAVRPETQQPAAPTTTQAPAAAAPTTGQQQRPEYAKAHLKELLARRRPNTQSQEPASPSKRSLAQELRHVRDLLREQHYVRAEEVLRGLAQQDPDNEVLRAYHLWSRMRIQQTDEKQVEELRELAKKLMAEAEHAAFASYALGHIYFNAKKDDLAEKFFKKAHGADRTNKDAERHVLILERRKQVAAEAENTANRKLFGIQISNTKPKV